MTYATPRHILALAEMLDAESYNLKTRSRETLPQTARQLRRIADILEGV